jgi:hypothetical protein
MNLTIDWLRICIEIQELRYGSARKGPRLSELDDGEEFASLD